MNTATQEFDAIMLDTETLGTIPGSIIYQIGAVQFCSSTFATGRSIQLDICPASAARCGLSSDQATLDWHRDRHHAAPLTATEGASLLKSALTTLNHFLTQCAPQQYWCKGASFDFPLLEAAYRAASTDRLPLTPPWRYYQQYDMRTLWNLAFPDDRTPDADHTALQDCYDQITHLQAAADRIINISNNKATLSPFL